MPAIPDDTLSAIQQHFHQLIRKRAGHLIEKHDIELPKLAPLLEEGALVNHLGKPGAWFPVDGWYGGFNYWLDGSKLMVDSWCRIIQGSGQRHEVTSEGFTLVEDEIV